MAIQRYSALLLKSLYQYRPQVHASPQKTHRLATSSLWTMLTAHTMNPILTGPDTSPGTFTFPEQNMISMYYLVSSYASNLSTPRVLDILFRFFTSWCLRIVPDLFLRDMYRAISVPPTQSRPKTTHYSPMLHNALISVATAFSDDPSVRDPKSRQRFASAAKSYIEAECQEPNISVVHGLSFLGSYHSSLGEQTLGYLYFGEFLHYPMGFGIHAGFNRDECTYRAGLWGPFCSPSLSCHTYFSVVGLSIDCSAWVKSGVISEHDMFDRNWAHWTTFTQVGYFLFRLDILITRRRTFVGRCMLDGITVFRRRSRYPYRLSTPLLTRYLGTIPRQTSLRSQISFLRRLLHHVSFL
jgi:hypothetical protein